MEVMYGSPYRYFFICVLLYRQQRSSLLLKFLSGLVVRSPMFSAKPDVSGAVSYTHLDVYKRQIQFCDLFYSIFQVKNHKKQQNSPLSRISESLHLPGGTETRAKSFASRNSLTKRFRTCVYMNFFSSFTL